MGDRCISNHTMNGVINTFFLKIKEKCCETQQLKE